MVKPSSFATLCTYDCMQELMGFLFSLSIHHRNEIVYVICDSKTKDKYDYMSFKPELDLRWFVQLDEYTKYNRSQMEQLGIWSDFQMYKSTVLDLALEEVPDCLFLDCDIIITDVIDGVDNTKELGVSPGFVKKEISDKYGYYNGGMLWTKNKKVPEKWREFTKSSRYFDQASIEDLHSYYARNNMVFEFNENYNVQSWRFICGTESAETLLDYIKPNPEQRKVLYKDLPLKFIHTHFNKDSFKKLNDIFIDIFKKAKMFKELLSIYRCIHDKWIISIPKQPMSGIGFHHNDSFREIPFLLSVNNRDIDSVTHTDSIHCKIMPNIVLYDRPTLTHVDKELGDSSLILLGNGDIKVEGRS